MYNSIIESKLVSEEIERDIQKFIDGGGKIEVIPVHVHVDANKTPFNYDGMREDDVADIEKLKKFEKIKREKDVKKKRSVERTSARKKARLEKAQLAYKLRQFMPIEMVAEQLSGSKTSVHRLLTLWRDHCKSSGIEYSVPSFRDTLTILEKKRAKEEKVAKMISDGLCKSYIGGILGVSDRRVEQIYRDYKKRVDNETK